MITKDMSKSYSAFYNIWQDFNSSIIAKFLCKFFCEYDTYKNFFLREFFLKILCIQGNLFPSFLNKENFNRKLNNNSMYRVCVYIHI